MSGSIYKITCVPTNKVYIGQATDVKYRCGKPYNYGPMGRWSDHVSSAKGKDTPLAQAIREYGAENFKVDILEVDLLERLDELEAKWIRELNSSVPNGLNVYKHSRNKHRLETTVQEHFKDITVSASIRPIKRDGKYRIVYLSLQLNNGEQRRLCFGQDSKMTFTEALEQARSFAKELGCPVTEENFTSNDSLTKYSKKLKQFDGRKIVRVRITTASSLVAVYITTADMESYKEQVRCCFGGKNITASDSYVEAKKFVELLDISDDCEVEDGISKSRQQVATS
jgi:group I intron endonuclease